MLGLSQETASNDCKRHVLLRNARPIRLSFHRSSELPSDTESFSSKLQLIVSLIQIHALGTRIFYILHLRGTRDLLRFSRETKVCPKRGPMTKGRIWTEEKSHYFRISFRCNGDGTCSGFFFSSLFKERRMANGKRGSKFVNTMDERIQWLRLILH